MTRRQTATFDQGCLRDLRSCMPTCVPTARLPRRAHLPRAH